MINSVYSLQEPAPAASIPLVFDSPHSGTHYPTNSGIVAPGSALNSTCDMFVDQLWSAAPEAGAALLAARFPRAYIDPNRSLTDLEPAMLESAWPTPLAPTERCMRGMGLIRRDALPGVPMYAGPLPVEDVQQRITRYYVPYHAALRQLIDGAHARFGQVWHVNCHSMKSVGNAMNTDHGSRRPDIVISDCDGTSCDGAFTDWVADELQRLGYRVSINSPYHGGQIVKDFGAPQHGRHSIQIEINRALYMNEARFEKHGGFEQLQRELAIFVASLHRYVKACLDHKAIA